MGLESLGEKQDGAGGLGFCSWTIWASRARQRGPGLERGVARGSGRLAEVQAGTAGRRGPEDTCHLILVEALDGGAEGTAHEALGCIGVVQEADLQGDEPILQRQGLHDLMALPVPHVYVATIQPWGGGWGQRVGSGSGQGSGQNPPHSPPGRKWKNRLEGLGRHLNKSEYLAQSYTITPRVGFIGGRSPGRGFQADRSSVHAQAPAGLWRGFSPASTSAGLKPSRKTLGAAHSVLIMTLCRGWYQKS